jgi:hypothetical protein
MKKILIFAVVISIFAFSSGCSVSKVSKLPAKKDMDIMAVGEHRAVIISEFGQPVESEIKNGKTVEIYAFEPGHGAGAKFARGFVYGAAGVYTLGISEIVATPLESNLSQQDKTVVEVVYDEKNLVEALTILKEGS